jgi:hypothetical protein
MDTELIDQLEDLIASLLMAESKARRAMQTMRKKRVYFGLDHNYLDDDIARFIGKVRHTKLLAERSAERAADDQRHPSSGSDVDGRVATLSDAGDALVANAVQDPTAIQSVVAEEVEGLIVTGDEPVGGAITEPVGNPPAIWQPPPVDDAPTVQQVMPDEADGLPPTIHPDTDGT